jgi:hypothetical protein
MVNRADIYIMASLIVSGIFSVLPTEVLANQIIDERKHLIQNAGMSENTSNATSTVRSNNTIILNVAEVDNEETYRWVDSTGSKNPDLNMISNKVYYKN